MKEENSPFVQFLLLAIYAIVGVVVFGLFGFALCLGLYGLDLIKDMGWTNGGNSQFIEAFKILLVAQQIGLFLTPAILLAVTEGKKLNSFYQFKIPKINGLFIVLLLMMAALPVMGLVNDLNQKMALPGFLKEIEAWMRASEDQLAKTTKAILKMTNWQTFLISLFVIAVVPAICEELMFRGALQRTFLRVFKNYHVAIWVSAIIFSAIHFQFYGFFPRLFLGAAFGYIYCWTGSLWYSILAHFINNGFAVSMAWYLQKNNLPFDKADETNLAWYGYLISAILTLVLFKFLKNQSAKNNES